MSIATSQVCDVRVVSSVIVVPPRLRMCGPKDAAIPAADPYSAGTTGPSSPPRPPWTGVGRSVSASATSSPGSRIRMPSSSDSIARFVRRSSTPTSSTPSTRCRRSPTPGSRPTTPSGPTTASARCRPSCFCRGLMPPHSLVLKCLLDGEAYALLVAGVGYGHPQNRQVGHHNRHNNHKDHELEPRRNRDGLDAADVIQCHDWVPLSAVGIIRLSEQEGTVSGLPCPCRKMDYATHA